MITKAVADIASATLATTESQQQAVSSYWTKSRMRNALPIPKLSSTARKAGKAHRKDGLLPLVPAGGQAPSLTKSSPASTTSSTWNSGGSISHAIGRVFFTLNNTDYTCSGTAVNSQNHDTVITAGHCVNAGPGAFATNWVFVPGYDNGKEPYDRWSARTLKATAAWTQNGDLNNDVGFAEMNKSSGKHLTDTVGAEAIGFNNPRGQYAYSFGYPAIAPYDGSKLYNCKGTPRNDTQGHNDQGIDCDMTEGSSGGPWLSNFNTSTGAGTVTSVNSFGYSDNPNVMYGPYFDNSIRDLYNTAQKA